MKRVAQILAIVILLYLAGLGAFVAAAANNPAGIILTIASLFALAIVAGG